MNDILYKDNCFFCNPDKSRIIDWSENFFAILGLGPIVEGYTIIASKQHYRSSFDIPQTLAEEHLSFKRHIRAMLAKEYGPSIMVEHGRIKACTQLEEDPHEDHCFHAHQLVFPVDINLIASLQIHGYFPKRFNSVEDATTHADPKKEYLYYENSSEQVFVADAPIPCRRQFLRYIVALLLGKGELADWRNYPGADLICSAKEKLTHSLPSWRQEKQYAKQ
jgi:diadenosine tetraphosphate (Ap4A) HIT family hydrolase